jgi:hypothetical protein
VSQPPSIIIELIRLPGNAAELKFRRTKDGAALPLRIDRPDERISTMRRDLPFLLGDFRKAVASVDIDLDNERMGNAVFHLKALAYYLLDLLVRGSGFDAATFALALARHLHPALVARDAERAPLIELLAPDGDELASLIPVEFMPLPSVRESELTAFLGFNAVVVRRRAEVSRTPLSRRKIPTQFFAYTGTGLKGTARQMQYFNRTAALVLAPNWPVQGLAAGQAAITGLTQTLLNLLTGPAPSPRKIAHFHCHFMPGGVNPAGQFTAVATLDFGCGVTISVPSLRGTMAQTPANSNAWSGEVLVFLNACQTASAGGIGGSLLEHLFTAGFKHIIGSETLIPDGLAAYFAERVYDALLAGETLGMAIYRARRYLIEDHGNPGGLLWSAFGDPDLRLRPAS